MNKYLLLTKTQMLEFVPKFLSRGKAAKKAIGYGGFALFGIFIAALAGAYEYMYATIFSQAGILDAFSPFLATVSMFIIILTTIGSSRQMIFSFGKIDSALSLPVSNATVIAARLTIIYLYNLFFSSIILLPGCVIYMLLAGFDPVFLIVSLIAMLFVPMVPLVFAAVIGALLAFMSARFRYANIVNTILIFAFLLAWIVLCGVFGFYSGSGEGAAQMTNIMAVNPFNGMLTRAYSGDFISLLLFAAVSAGTFILFCLAFSKCFKSLQTAFASRLGKVKYSYEKSNSSSFKALLSKEKSRFLSSSAYMSNACIGPLLLIIAGIVLIVFKDRLIEYIVPMFDSYDVMMKVLSALLPLAIIYFGGLGTVSSCSISLEGKSFAILKSLPVPGKTVIKAKLTFSCIISVVPVFIVSTVSAIVFGFPVPNALCVILTPTLYSFFVNVFGLLMNLKKYRFDYSNETQIIKQSLPVTLTVLMTLGLTMVLIAVTVITAIFSAENIAVASFCVLGIMAIAAAAASYVLFSKGEKMYRNILI